MSDERDTELENALIGRLAESLAPISPPAALAARMRQRLLDEVRAAAPTEPEVQFTVSAAEGSRFKILPGIAMKMLRAALAAWLRRRLLNAVRTAAPAQPDVHLTIHAAEGNWFEILPGITVKMLRQDDISCSYLLRLAPRASLPAHPHTLDEECVVLAGDVWLGDVQARAGDFHLARGGTPHGEIRSEGGCLLYLRGENYASGANLN